MTRITEDGSAEFRFYRPAAQAVWLAGDFSRWADRAVAMRPDGRGWWTARLQLPPGEHRFRYIADGTWYTDFAANGVEVSGLAWNSVLVVQENNREQDDDAIESARNYKTMTMATSAA